LKERKAGDIANWIVDSTLGVVHFDWDQGIPLYLYMVETENLFKFHTKVDFHAKACKKFQSFI
jgi:hypothetical protein